MTERDVEYLACDGGPHILLPFALASYWDGIPLDVEDVLDPATDYGRACLVDSDDVALIDVGPGKALVLGGSPPLTTWRALDDGRGVDVIVLLEWHTRDLEALVDAGVAEATSALSSCEPFRWEVPDGGAVLMFAGDQVNSHAYGVLPVALRPGSYAVSATTLEVDLGAIKICRIESRSP